MLVFCSRLQIEEIDRDGIRGLVETSEVARLCSEGDRRLALEGPQLLNLPWTGQERDGEFAWETLLAGLEA